MRKRSTRNFLAVAGVWMLDEKAGAAIMSSFVRPVVRELPDEVSFLVAGLFLIRGGLGG